MSILSTVKKGYISIKTASGYMKLLPRTLASLVSMSDGTSVENKISSLIPTVEHLGSPTQDSQKYQYSIRYPDGRMVEYGWLLLDVYGNPSVVTGDLNFLYSFSSLPIVISTLNNQDNSNIIVATHVAVTPGTSKTNFAAHNISGNLNSWNFFKAYYVAFGRWK